MPAPSGNIKSDEAAALLGVSRRTLYRWIGEGRLAYPITREDIETRRPTVRQRGPRRNPRSARYLTGRHTFKQYETPH